MKMLDDSAIRNPSPELLKTLQFTRRRRTLTWINLAVAIVLMLGIVVVVNLITRTHSARFNWTADRIEDLSPETIQHLKTLPGEVTIDVLMNKFVDGQALQSDRALSEAWRLTELMILEFARQNPDRIRIAATEEGRLPPSWMKDFSSMESNSIYLRCVRENKAASTRAFNIHELYRDNPQTGEIVDFRAEQMLISAIWTMVSSKKVVYYTTGHDECRVEDPRQGMSLLVYFLHERDNVEFRALDLGAGDRVPRDADAVFVAGPRRDFPVAHLDALKEYMEGGGRLILAADPMAGVFQLKKFLLGWGVRLGSGVVCDRGSYVDKNDNIRVKAFGDHAINYGITLPDHYIDVPVTTTVRIEPPTDRKIIAQSLFRSSDDSFEDVNLDGNEGKGEVGADLDLALAIEGEPAKKPRDPRRPTPKLIVWGSVLAFTNAVARPDRNPYGMAYLLNNFRWVLEMEQVIAPPQKRKIQMTPVDLGRRGRQQIAWIAIGVMPMMGVILGILAWWFRRK